MLVFDSFENDRLLTHHAADKSAPARKGGCRPLAHNPKLLTVVVFAPGVVVMVVHYAQFQQFAFRWQSLESRLFRSIGAQILG